MGSRNLLPLVVGDFNGDASWILPSTRSLQGNNVTLLLGDGKGGFTAATGSPLRGRARAPHSLAVGDFNGDGKPDLAIANGASNNVTVLLGNGSGGFTAAPGSPFAVGSGPQSVAVGDFNGDGKPDLAIANFNGSTVTVLLGTGTGGFTAGPQAPIRRGIATRLRGGRGLQRRRQAGPRHGQ